MSAPLTMADGVVLTGLAAAAIAARLAGHPLDGSAPDSPALRVDGASFVTLHTGGKLRGCVGSLAPDRPLYQDVVRNAVQAMTDPRLPPVTAEDWPALDLSVSVLSTLEHVPCTHRQDLVAALRPGVDGLVLTQGARQATFLPAVWEKLPVPQRFVAALLDKGGWPVDSWPASLSAHRYHTVEFHDLGRRTTSGH